MPRNVEIKARIESVDAIAATVATWLIADVLRLRARPDETARAIRDGR